MSRSRVIYSDFHPYHVTARTNNREQFDVPMCYCFGIYNNVLEECIKRFNINLHAFVLMSNHFHMIITTPEKNIGEFLKYFMTQTSKAIAKKNNRINHIYGGRNYKCLISTAEYYAHCLRYVYQNPIKAGLCEGVDDYQWSTISNIPNKMQQLITLPKNGHDAYIPIDKPKLIDWLNESLSCEVNEVIRYAMKRPSFEPKACKTTRKYLNLNQWL